MLVVRIIGVIAVLLVAAGVVGYLLTGERRYLRFAWRAFMATLGLVLLMLALLFLERLAVIPLPL
jgi:hypothetical protein